MTISADASILCIVLDFLFKTAAKVKGYRYAYLFLVSCTQGFPVMLFCVDTVKVMVGVKVSSQGYGWG